MSIARALLLVLAALVPAAHAETIKVALQNLTPAQLMEFRCITDTRVIQLPLPDRWAVRRVTLNLRYTVSNNLISDVSQLVVKVNGVPVSQLRLNAQAPDAQVAVPIPVELLEPGYNAITFQVAQHYSRQQCEPPCAADLWTAVNLRDSHFQFDYALKPVPLEMSRLSSIFDARLLPYGEVHIITAEQSAAAATLAGIVASGVARRFDYRKVKFSVSRELKPGTDNVLIGLRREVEEFLKKHNVAVPKIEGGYLRIAHLPSERGADTTRALVIVSGETPEAVKIAAETFANITFGLPGSSEIKAFEFALPDIRQYTGREALTSGSLYAFKTLNFPTQTFRGLNPPAGTISFRLPADFHIRPNQYAKVAINFSYGAGLKAGSSLQVSVNGRHVRAIALENPSGNFIENYKIEIPTYVFKAGTNTIEFAPNPQIAGQICDLLQVEGLFVTLFENSTLQFPEMPHFVEMPKLELFMHNGFPFTRWPDGHETTVVLGAKDDRLLAAALNLLGIATQRNGFPLFGVQFTYDNAQAGELIVVGPAAGIPEEVARAAPMAFGKEMISRVPYPVITGWDTEVTMAYSKQTSALAPGRALLMQFQSPFEGGRTVMMLTGSRVEDILTASEALLGADVQAKASGDLVLIESAAGEPRVSAIRVGARYMTGKSGTSTMLESLLFTQPLVFYSVITALIGALGAAIFFAVRRYRSRRLISKAASE